MGLSVEKVSAEAGGTMEFNIPPSSPVAACDRLVQFRAAFKAAARRCGYLGTLVPRAVTGGPICGIHLHLSMLRADSGHDALVDPATGTGAAPAVMSCLGCSPMRRLSPQRERTR